MPRAVRTFLGLWAPVLVYLGMITYLSHQPALKIPGGLPDWPFHVVEYAGLALLVARAAPLRTPKIGMAVFAGTAAFGALDELHQGFVPGRDASLRDLAADAAGSALALGLVLLARRAKPRVRPVQITLFGRAGCHLCDEAEALLASASVRYAIDVSKVDIDGDPELSRLYSNEVPVIAIEGKRWSKLRLDPERLRRKLASVAQRRTP